MKRPSLHLRTLPAAALFPIFLTAMSASAQTPISGGAIYKAPASFVSGGVVSQQYSIRLKASRLTSATAWQTVDVLWSKLKDTYVEGDHEFNEKYYKNLWGCSHSYVNFEMTESIDIEISKKDGTSISANTKIYPANKAINLKFINGKATFTMPRPCNVAVDVNGEMAVRTQTDSPPAVHALSVHGNPVLEGKPAATSPDVFSVTPGTPPTPTQLENFKNSATLKTMYFRPGIHTIGANFKIYPNKKYYIPGDAVVYGTFNNHKEKAIPSISPEIAPGDAKNIKIFGHGTLSGQKLTHWELDKVNLNNDYNKDSAPVAPVVTVLQADKNSNPTNATYAEQQRISYRKRPIDLTYCSNVKVQGIVIADPANNSMNLFNISLESDNSNEVSWVKIFAWRVNSDGSGINDSSRVFNCFYRVQDDGFYPKGIALSDNVLWSDANGASLRLSHLHQLKTEAMLKLFKTDTLRVENIDVIFRRNLSWSNSGAIELPKDNTIRDKKFVFSNINISDPNPSKPPLRIEQGTGSLSNVRFENVTIEAMPGAPNDKNIISADTGGSISIAFHNLIIRGEVVTDTNYTKYFNINGNVNLIFTNSLLSKTGWVPAASGTGIAGFAIDDDINSRWATNAVQVTSGQYFQVDMMSNRNFDRIMLNSVAAKDDYPRSYKVILGKYNNMTGLLEWRTVATGCGAGATTVIAFPPQSAQFIRVEQTGSTTFNWWSIYDFKVFESSALDRTSWAAEGSSTSYGPFALDGDLNTRWDTQEAQTISSQLSFPAQQYFQVDMKSVKIFSKISLDSGVTPGDYPRGYAVYVSADGLSWGNPVAVGNGYGPATLITFPQQKAQYIRLCQTGNASWNWWSISEFHVSETETSSGFDRTGWTTVSSSTSYGPFAIDGDLNTRWDTQGVQAAPQQYFQVDMKSARTFNRISLDSGGALGDYPRGYTVYVSTDGLNWGDAPVAMGYGYGSATSITLPQQTARYIRINQTGIAPWNWWSISEFNVYY